MTFEEQYEDVLQSLEFGIVSVYRQNPDMTDYAVARALEGVLIRYVAEQRGRIPRPFPLRDIERQVFDRVVGMAELRLGRASADAMPEVKHISLDELAQCLKRIEKSVQRWNKQGGDQGYLRFVSQYIG
jgi:hypothetical protein